jgi:hypothetical protein
MDVKNLTSSVEPCQRCEKAFLENKSIYYCDDCYDILLPQVEEMQKRGILCCSVLNPGRRGPQGPAGPAHI